MKSSAVVSIYIYMTMHARYCKHRTDIRYTEFASLPELAGPTYDLSIHS